MNRKTKAPRQPERHAVKVCLDSDVVRWLGAMKNRKDDIFNSILRKAMLKELKK